MKNKLFLFIALCSGLIINAQELTLGDEIDPVSGRSRRQLNEMNVAAINLGNSKEPVNEKTLNKLAHKILGTDFPTDRISATLELINDIKNNPSLGKCLEYQFELITRSQSLTKQQVQKAADKDKQHQLPHESTIEHLLLDNEQPVMNLILGRLSNKELIKKCDECSKIIEDYRRLLMERSEKSNNNN